MKIVTTRRISQIIFFAMFLWFCIVSSFGTGWWQLRGWPVNFFLQLDPLIAIANILTTHTLYAALGWALVTVILTILFGRFFCSWVCPFGSLHQVIGYLGNRKKTTAQKIKLNKYRKAQNIKYFILIVFLVFAAVPVSKSTSLQIGLLDPISLVYRSFNTVVLPIVDNLINVISTDDRAYQLSWLVGAVFLTAILLNLVIPRFYCRFICPLGALLAIFGRFAIWRIGKNTEQCSNCMLCESSCEGGCEPAGNIRISECVLCFNCLEDRKDQVISYQTVPSLAGEITNPDISRRGFLLSIATGLFALPASRLSAKLTTNWHHKLIRPPGALAEDEFLKRCIKCGQCMRICPTNVLQPAGFEGGLETLWTPILNNRIGSSACQLNCVACSNICPTAAIRPITLSEKLGTDQFSQVGPIRIGTAFVDRSRCLPWAMDKPCIVCQENCPVSPKAIFTREEFVIIRDGIFAIKATDALKIEIWSPQLTAEEFAAGDYYCNISSNPENERRKVVANTEDTVTIDKKKPWSSPASPGDKLLIQVRLQRPYIDIEKCIGCGICEHECPVRGKPAIRVSAEGETRSIERSILLKRS